MANNDFVKEFVESEDSFEMDPDSKEKFVEYLEKEKADPKSVDDVKKAFDAFSSNDDGGANKGSVSP